MTPAPPPVSEDVSVATPAPVELPQGSWYRLSRTRENGVSGWVIDRMEVAGEAYTLERIHGPDILPVCEARLMREVTP
jgi:hypothetical protein